MYFNSHVLDQAQYRSCFKNYRINVGREMIRVNDTKHLSYLMLSFLCMGQSVNASTISVSGAFNNPVATDYYFVNRTYNQDDETSPARHLPNNLNTTTDSVAYFGWGVNPYESYKQRQKIQSHFWFNGTGSVDGSNNTTPLIGEAFSLGSFTYTNEQTIFSGGYVEVNFSMDITIDDLELSPVGYTIGIDNTQNSSANPQDTINLLSSPDDLLFSLNNTQYRLTLNGFTRDGGQTFETSAVLPENMQTTAEIYGTFTVVPVPGAIWLFGSGFIFLAGCLRRQKLNQ